MSALRIFLAAAALATLATPATAQHAGHDMPAATAPARDMPGMNNAAPARRDVQTKAKAGSGFKAGPSQAGKQGAAATGAAPMSSMDHRAMGYGEPQPSTPPKTTDPHAGMDHSPMPSGDRGAEAGMDHSEMNHAGMTHATAGTALSAGDASAPAAPEPNYADRIWGREAMERSRADLRHEHGGMLYSQVLLNLMEYQVRDGRDGLRWDGEGFYGDDLNRFVARSEGSTDNGGGVEDAEIQLLYSRTVGPYTFLQAGVRQDFAPRGTTYASLGFETLVPYWFDVEGTLFVSHRGDILARAEAYYDLRITQRLILQPRAELNLAAQDVREAGTGAGISDVELGLRLRYEVRREFAPYIGVSYDRDFGRTARFTQARGESTSAASFVVGIRAWF